MQKRENGERISASSRIPSEQYTGMQKAAENLGCTISTIMRMAINEWMKHGNQIHRESCVSLTKQSRNMRIVCFVTKEQHEALQVTADRENCTVSMIVREAVCTWLQNHPND